MICRIREWKLSDAGDLAAALSNQKVLDNLRDGMPYPYTKEDALSFISAARAAGDSKFFCFAVTVDERAIGSVSVVRQDNIHRQSAELGAYLSEEYWGRGVMTEAVRQICARVFEQTDIIRIYAQTFAHNGAACRVLEKAGFQYEGTLRSGAVKHGKVLDLKMYSILKSEMRKLQKELEGL